jgi:hypothetical protein
MFGLLAPMDRQRVCPVLNMLAARCFEVAKIGETYAGRRVSRSLAFSWDAEVPFAESSAKISSDLASRRTDSSGVIIERATCGQVY